MISINDILVQVQQDLVRNLNGYIESTQEEGESWFKPLTFLDGAPRVESDRYKMGIYLSSPEGEVFQSDGRTMNISVSLDCLLDDSKENSSDPQRYLSAVISYLSKREYGTSSVPYTAVCVRTDLGADVNGFAVAIKVSLYEFDMDIL